MIFVCGFCLDTSLHFAVESSYDTGVGYFGPVSYTHLRAHETSLHLVCRLLLEKKTSPVFIFARKSKIKSPLAPMLFAGA